MQRSHGRSSALSHIELDWNKVIESWTLVSNTRGRQS